MITSLFNKTFRKENVEHKEVIKSKGNEKYMSSSIKQYKEAVDVSSEEISKITIRDILNISIKFCWGDSFTSHNDKRRRNYISAYRFRVSYSLYLRLVKKSKYRCKGRI